MGNRKQTAEILYPFTPEGEPFREQVNGILDVFFVISEPGVSTANESSSSNSNAGDTDYNPYFTVLAEMEAAPTANTYTFYVHSPGYKQKLTFISPITGGIMRITSQESDLCWMLVNADRLYGISGTIHHMDVPVEPARTVYQLGGVKSITLANEYRDYDPRTRPESIQANADRTIFHTPNQNSVLSLVDGYNCALEYDADEGVLYINGGPGLGKGLPKEIPWDNTAVLDIFNGIKSINGQNEDSSVHIDFKNSLRPEYGDHLIDIIVSDGE